MVVPHRNPSALALGLITVYHPGFPVLTERRESELGTWYITYGDISSSDGRVAPTVSPAPSLGATWQSLESGELENTLW